MHCLKYNNELKGFTESALVRQKINAESEYTDDYRLTARSLPIDSSPTDSQNQIGVFSQTPDKKIWSIKYEIRYSLPIE